MNYLICEKCGIKRNTVEASDCPICKFDDLKIIKAIQKEYISQKGKDTKEEIKALFEMREALSENIKSLWKLSIKIGNETTTTKRIAR